MCMLLIVSVSGESLRWFEGECMGDRRVGKHGQLVLKSMLCVCVRLNVCAMVVLACALLAAESCIWIIFLLGM